MDVGHRAASVRVALVAAVLGPAAGFQPGAIAASAGVQPRGIAAAPPTALVLQPQQVAGWRRRTMRARALGGLSSCASAASEKPLAAEVPGRGIVIRSFCEATDGAAVRRIFSDGMNSMTVDGFVALARALALPVAAACALASAAAAGSGCGPAAACAAGVLPFVGFMGGVLAYFRRMVRAYVAKSLTEDLLDIEAFYLARPQSHFFVAVERAADATEHVLGCVALEHKPSDETYAGWGELRRMSVSAAGRRRGIATKLNEALVAHASAHGLKGVFLSTSTLQLAAIALYVRLGYTQVRTSSLYPNFLLKDAVRFVSFERRLSTP